jgi:hypothetical protein
VQPHGPHRTFNQPRRVGLWVAFAGASIILAGAHRVAAQEGNDPFLTTALDDWGVPEPSALRFGLIALIHEATGPRLIPYKLSAHDPPRFQPSAAGSVPSFEGNTLTVHGPGDGNRNRLGGYFNAFQSSPSRSDVTLAASPDGRRSLKLSLRREAEGFCGMWVHLFDFSRRPDRREYLDASPFGVLSFWVRGEAGGEELLLKIADVEWELKEDALAIGRLGDFVPAGRIETEWQRAVIPLLRLPPPLVRSALASIVFEGAVEGGATVYIRQVALSITPDDLPALGGPDSTPYTSDDAPKATWVWNTTPLLADRAARTSLAEFLEAQGFDRVFLQLPGLPGETGHLGGDTWEREAFRDLLRGLRDAGLEVYALDGFRSYALAKHHPAVLSIVDRVVRHNKNAPPDARFDGLHHNIEPYLLAGFHGSRRDQILLDYLELVAEAARRLREAGLTYGLDIPFWYDAPDEESYEPVQVAYEGVRKPASEHLIDLVDEVTVMDYRTTAYGADGTIRHARDELEYAASVGKKLWIGLETGPLPDEDLLYLRGTPERGPPADPGEYIVAEVIGDSTRMTLERVPEPDSAARVAGPDTGRGAPADGRIWWKVVRRVPVPADKLTFARLGLEALQRIMDETGFEFGDSPAFGGFAIHYDESLRRLLECRTPAKCREVVRIP